MEAIIFSWSGSFRKDLKHRRENITSFIQSVQDNYGMEVGLLSEQTREQTEKEADIEALGIDFAIGEVEDILKVMRAMAQKYDKVFFISDVQAEIVAVNQSGAYTVGYNSKHRSADELGEVGPNYIVDSLGEFRQILLMEHMK